MFQYCTTTSILQCFVYEWLSGAIMKVGVANYSTWATEYDFKRALLLSVYKHWFSRYRLKMIREGHKRLEWN